MDPRPWHRICAVQCAVVTAQRNLRSTSYGLNTRVCVSWQSEGHTTSLKSASTSIGDCNIRVNELQAQLRAMTGLPDALAALQQRVEGMEAAHASAPAGGLTKAEVADMIDARLAEERSKGVSACQCVRAASVVARACVPVHVTTTLTLRTLVGSCCAVCGQRYTAAKIRCSWS